MGTATKKKPATKKPAAKVTGKAKKKESGNDIVQKYFKGAAPVKIRAIETLANRVKSLQTERMELQASEGEERGKLLELMKHHKITEYKFNGLVVTKEITDEKVFVRKQKPVPEMKL